MGMTKKQAFCVPGWESPDETYASSSNEKVAYVDTDEWDKKSITITPNKKTGTTIITAKCGKKKYVCKVKVIAYRNPFKKLSVCGTDIKRAFNYGNHEGTYCTYSYVKKNKGKISIKMNSKFKLKKIKIGKKTVKNNSTTNWSGDEVVVTVLVLNKLTNDIEEYQTKITGNKENLQYNPKY